jgi:hypothetical protein
MPIVFISYKRNQPTNNTAIKLFNRLTRYIGVEDSVFLDTKSIPPGENFADYIRENLPQCEVIVILVDRAWCRCLTADGGRYPTPANYWIGLEIQEALQAEHIRRFLVRIDDIEMPSKEDFPEELQDILNSNALPFRNVQFEADFYRLTRELNRFIQDTARQPLKNTSSNFDRYFNEVQYCVEGGFGNLNEFSRLYLETLSSYLNVVREIEQANYLDRAQKSFFSYMLIVIRLTERSIKDNPQKGFPIKSVLLRYLARLNKIFDIANWRAWHIKGLIEAKWKDAIRTWSESIRLELDTVPLDDYPQSSNNTSLLVDDIVNNSSFTTLARNLQANLAGIFPQESLSSSSIDLSLDSSVIESKVRSIALEMIKSRLKMIGRCFHFSPRVLSRLYFQIQTRYLSVQEPADCVLQLKDKLGQFFEGDSQEIFDRDILRFQKLLVKQQLPESLLNEVADRAVDNWLQQQRNRAS